MDDPLFELIAVAGKFVFKHTLRVVQTQTGKAIVGRAAAMGAAAATQAGADKLRDKGVDIPDGVDTIAVAAAGMAAGAASLRAIAAQSPMNASPMDHAGSQTAAAPRNPLLPMHNYDGDARPPRLTGPPVLRQVAEPPLDINPYQGPNPMTPPPEPPPQPPPPPIQYGSH